MKNTVEKIFTKYSPSEYIHTILSGEKQDRYAVKDKKVYLNSRGELILNLDHPKVKEKLVGQIQAFAGVELNNQR